MPGYSDDGSALRAFSRMLTGNRKLAGDGDQDLNNLSLVGDEPRAYLVGTAQPCLQIHRKRRLLDLLLKLQQPCQISLHQEEPLQRFGKALAHIRTLVDPAVQ